MKFEEKIKKVMGKLKISKTRSSTEIKEIDYERLKEEIKTNGNLSLIDIRSPQEFAENRIRFAMNIPLYDLNTHIERTIPDKNRFIVLYCEYGLRSKKAYRILEQKGYTNVYSLKGGLEGIK